VNWDEISGGWSQVKGKVREQWGELTDSDLDRIGGRKDQLVGLLQQKYGHLRAAAEHELDEWAAALKPDAPAPTASTTAPAATQPTPASEAPAPSATADRT